MRQEEMIRNLLIGSFLGLLMMAVVGCGECHGDACGEDEGTSQTSCEIDSDCSGGNVCQDEFCVLGELSTVRDVMDCDGKGDCGSPPVCEEADDSCSNSENLGLLDAGKSCDENNPCETGSSCNDGQCEQLGIPRDQSDGPQACDSETPCPGGQVCKYFSCRETN
jgi:hypothetical protein